MSGRVELTDAERETIAETLNDEAFTGPEHEMWAAVESIVAARVHTENQRLLTVMDREMDKLQTACGQRDAARAELAAANARCAELEEQKVVDHETWLQEVEERDAMLIERDARLDRVTALADEWIECYEPAGETLRAALADSVTKDGSNDG